MRGSTGKAPGTSSTKLRRLPYRLLPSIGPQHRIHRCSPREIGHLEKGTNGTGSGRNLQWIVHPCSSTRYSMPNHKTIARWTLWFLLLLPLAQVGGPLAWACGVQSHCPANTGGCGGVGQPCGSVCSHTAAPERSCCATAVSAQQGQEAGCACKVQAPTERSGILLLLAPELSVLASTAVPQFARTSEQVQAPRRPSDAPLRLIALSPYGSRGPPSEKVIV